MAWSMKTDNELIAEFDGFKFYDDDKEAFPVGYYSHDEEHGVRCIEDFEYHNSWDWLMPVVIKCHEIGDAKEKEFPESKGLDDSTGWKAWSYRRVGLSTDINQVFKNVVTFIEYFNQQSK